MTLLASPRLRASQLSAQDGLVTEKRATHVKGAGKLRVFAKNQLKMHCRVGYLRCIGGPPHKPTHEATRPPIRLQRSRGGALWSVLMADAMGVGVGVGVGLKQDKLNIL